MPLKVIKLRLEAEQQIFFSLDGQSRICNWLYNYLLDKANKLKEQFIQHKDLEAAKIVYTERGLRNLLPELKNECPFLKSVHSSPLKNAALRLSQAIQARQKSKKGKRAGKEIGWPHFRSWQAGWFSLLYDEPSKGFKVQENKLTLSLGMGEQSKRQSLTLTLKEASLLKGQKIRTLRIVKQANVYYAVFTVEIQIIAPKPIQRVIAFDPNHKNMACGVDNQGKSLLIDAPSWLKTFDKRIDELKSKRDRCLKRSKPMALKNAQGEIVKELLLPSRRWLKCQQALEKARHKRQEQTKTYVYTLAHAICKEYDAVAIGDYTPRGEGLTKAMRRSMNNRSLIGRFKEALKWVAEKSGKTFFEYDEKGTTRTCHCCGYAHPESLSPSIRTWRCPECRQAHFRDENAAVNGLKKIFKDHKISEPVSQVPCSGPFLIVERWAWRVQPSGVRKTSRGLNSKQLQRQEIELGV